MTAGFKRLEGDPPRDAVGRVTFVPFLPDGLCAVIDEDGDGRGLALPSGDVGEGENYLLDTALRVPLEQAGFHYQRFHPFGRAGRHLFAWIEGDVYRGRRPHRVVPLAAFPAEEAAVRLPADMADVVAAAADSYRNQTDESYFADAIRTLESAYLRATTPEGGSGFGRGPDEWRAARHSISTGIIGDGTFLDVGCANGLLMESVRTWCGERGLVVEPYGVDLAPRLVALAQRRLPEWADRIWLGNAVDWVHPDGRRFDSVHVGLWSVPVGRRAQMVRHHLDDTVAPGGRLLVSHYTSLGSTHNPPVADILTALGFDLAGGAGQTAWIDRP